MEVGIARLVVAIRVVDHLGFRGQALHATARYCPNGGKSISGVQERLPCLGGQVATTLLVDADGMNIYLSPSVIPEDEVPIRPSDMFESAVREHLPHPSHMFVSHDEVEVFVRTSLLAHERVNAPAAVQPHLYIGRSEQIEQLGDTLRAHHLGHSLARAVSLGLRTPIAPAALPGIRRPVPSIEHRPTGTDLRRSGSRRSCDLQPISLTRQLIRTFE